MAGAFSGHLIDSFYSAHRSPGPGPFGMPFNTSFNNPPSDIFTSGAMSFNRSMHGTAHPQASMSMFGPDDTSYMDMSEATAIKIAALQAKLNQKLGPEYISQRPGPGGGPKLTYAEGWKIINLANEVFGFNGWSSTVVSLTTDFVDLNEETKRYSVGVTAIVRVTLRDGVHHEDVGYGLLENSKSKGAALDKCKKEAVTDAIKRSLRNFGNLLGNCLYDKSYTQEIVKIKVTQPKFDPEQLHRRPEFTDVKPKTEHTNTTSTSHVNGPGTNAARPQPNPPAQPPRTNSTTPVIKTEPTNPRSLPSHVHDPVRQTPMEHSSKASTSIGKSNSNTARTTASMQQPTGLNTPITPAHQPVSHHASSNQTAGSTNQARKVAFAAEQSPLAGRPSAPPVAAPTSDETLQDDDELYDINSEDDAFFATVDLGDGDLGRPIEYDESMCEGGEESFIGDQSGLGVQHQPQHQGHHRAPSKPNSMGPPPVPAPHERGGSRSAAIEAALVAAAASSSSASAVQQPRSNQQQSTSHQYRPNHDRENSGSHVQFANAPKDNRENHNPHSSASSAKETTPAVFSSGVNASSTPRRGGFSFPPEMMNQNRPAAQPQPHGQAGVGFKRNADAMRGTSSRRPAQGMGLMGAQGGGSTRQPLGDLDVGDGGDAKRIRR